MIALLRACFIESSATLEAPEVPAIAISYTNEDSSNLEAPEVPAIAIS